MRKKNRLLALVLVGIMSFIPAGESMATSVDSAVIEESNAQANETDVILSEERESIEYGDIEDETVTQGVEEEQIVSTSCTEGETEEIETETEEAQTQVETETEEAQTQIETETEEVQTQIETETEEVQTQVETETEEAQTQVETETEEIQTQIETDTIVDEIQTQTEDIERETIEIETETESETTEIETEIEEKINLPGMLNYTLTEKEKVELGVLSDNILNISEAIEGVDYVKGQIVFWADTEDMAHEVIKGYNAKLVSYNNNIVVAQLPEEVSVIEALELAAAQTEDVVLAPVWPNYYRYMYAENSGTNVEVIEETIEEIDESSEVVNIMNDPYLSSDSDCYQWQHNMVGSRAAWYAGYTGKNIKIAILDTGINTKHEDLNVIYNENLVDNSTVDDNNGHGTHIAGIAAATLGNSKGGSGIAPDAGIINVKVLNDGGVGTDADIMEGIKSAITNNADIINISCGSGYYSAVFESVVERAYNNGVAIFAAAGNNANDEKCYPAAYKGVYAVGCVNQGKILSDTSNYGKWVDFNAPGVEIYSSYMENNSSYKEMSGTSQASAVISGIAAVVLSADVAVNEMSGSEKVDALISIMNKGSESGVVDMRGALGVKDTYDRPSAPTFSVKSGTKVSGNVMTLTISKGLSTDSVYYSLDGKSVTFKNGVPSSNAYKYSKPITIGNAAKVTVKAIAVNPAGVSGPASSATYKFAPKVDSISITGANVLLKGKSTKLSAIVLPTHAENKKITWNVKPQNQGVTVSNGTVKATKSAQIGTYTISALAADGSQKSDTFKIKITDKAVVKSIKFTTSKATETYKSSAKTYSLQDKIKVTLVDGTVGNMSHVSWASSDTSIATVKQGNVTIKNSGKVKITATATDGSGKKAVFTLTIKQLATSVKLSGYNHLAVGKSIKLSADVLPQNTANKKVKWSVLPEGQGVAVSNGTLKASSNANTGKYTVTATTSDGTNVSGTMTVVVKDNAITKIVLNQKKVNIFRVSGNSKAPKSVNISANIIAKDINNAVKYTSSNPGIATVSQNGTSAVVTATGKATGTTKITCMALDGSNKTATCTVTVTNPASMIKIVPTSGYSYNIAKGKTAKFKVVFEEGFGKVKNRKVTWKSGNESVAKVNGGNVKAVSAFADTIIKAEVADGSKVVAGCSVITWNSFKKITTSPEANTRWIRVVSKLGQKGYLDIKFDGKYNSKAGACPYMDVSVSNPNVMSADVLMDNKGNLYLEVYGHKLGSSKFTLTALDGSRYKYTGTIHIVK